MGTGSSFSGVKAAEALFTSKKWWSQENANLYIHSPKRLHGVELNEFSTGTNFHYLQQVTVALRVVGDEKGTWSLEYIWNTLLPGGYTHKYKDLVFQAGWEAHDLTLQKCCCEIQRSENFCTLAECSKERYG
jgi:hypothetical protein